MTLMRRTIVTPCCKAKLRCTVDKNKLTCTAADKFGFIFDCTECEEKFNIKFKFDYRGMVWRVHKKEVLK